MFQYCLFQAPVRGYEKSYLQEMYIWLQIHNITCHLPALRTFFSSLYQRSVLIYCLKGMFNSISKHQVTHHLFIVFLHFLFSKIIGTTSWPISADFCCFFCYRRKKLHLHSIFRSNQCIMRLSILLLHVDHFWFHLSVAKCEEERNRFEAIRLIQSSRNHCKINYSTQLDLCSCLLRLLNSCHHSVFEHLHTEITNH